MSLYDADQFEPCDGDAGSTANRLAATARMVAGWKRVRQTRETADAVRFHMPTLEAAIERHMLRATVVVTTNVVAGEVALRFTFADDEDRAGNTQAMLRLAYHVMQSIGFYVAWRGVPAYVSLTGYFGRAVTEAAA